MTGACDEGLGRLTSILVALWAGSLWTICGIVAPTLFAVLDDRQQAGRLAARFFHIEAWLGAAIGLALIAIFATRKAPAGKAVGGLIAFTAGAPLLSQWGIGPLLDSARAANDMSRFGMLHGIASLLFLAACLGALALVWKLNRPAE